MIAYDDGTTPDGSNEGIRINLGDRTRKQLETWANEGYDISGLEKAYQKDIGTFGELYNRFFKEPVSYMGTDPTAKTTINLGDRSRKQLEIWAAAGHDISELENAYAGDITRFGELYNQFFKDLNIPVEGGESSLDEIVAPEKDEAVAYEIDSIPTSRLDDMTKYHQVMDDTTTLLEQAKVTLEESKGLEHKNVDISEVLKASMDDGLEEYRLKMKAWEKEGYNITRLSIVLASGLPKIVDRVFTSFEKDIERLNEIEKSLDVLDTSGFKKRESDIREELKNPETTILTIKHFIELSIDVRRKMEMDV